MSNNFTMPPTAGADVAGLACAADAPDAAVGTVDFCGVDGAGGNARCVPDGGGANPCSSSLGLSPGSDRDLHCGGAFCAAVSGMPPTAGSWQVPQMNRY